MGTRRAHVGTVRLCEIEELLCISQQVHEDVGSARLLTPPRIGCASSLHAAGGGTGSFIMFRSSDH